MRMDGPRRPAVPSPGGTPRESRLGCLSAGTNRPLARMAHQRRKAVEALSSGHLLVRGVAGVVPLLLLFLAALLFIIGTSGDPWGLA
jgi:hypothetical protein